MIDPNLSQPMTCNPWISMWLHPRQTIGQVVDYNPRHRFLVLSAFYGWIICLHYAQSLSLGLNVAFWHILLASLILCIPVGAISILFTTALVYVTGKIIRGKASFIELRAAVSWSNITSIINVLLTFILIGMFQDLLFVRGLAGIPISDTASQILFCIMIVEIAIAVWRIILLIASVSKVQRFSTWMSLLNLILVFAVLLLLNYLGERILMVTSSPSTLSLTTHLFISP